MSFRPLRALRDVFGRQARIPLGARLESFRHLLARNNRVLELIADAGAKLGGDYLFDAQYVRELEGELAEAVRAVVHDLAELSGDRYPALLASFERIQAGVRASLEGRVERLDGPLVVRLDEVGSELAPLVGEKMARLGELRGRLDLEVPDGFVISVAACQRLLEQPGLAAQLEAVRRSDASAAEASARLVEAIESATVPRDVVRAIQRGLAPFDRRASFAVRSSAVGEDSGSTFAGQHLTVLNVRRDDVLHAWLRVVASLFAPPALEYRRRLGLPPPGAEMAVGCILVVPAASSGVVHTLDPTAPEGGTAAVTATRGLGVLAAEGRGTTDRFTVSRMPPHAVLSRAVATKAEMCVAVDTGGVRVVPVPAPEQRAPAVGDAVLAEVVGAALRIERHMRCRQEVEWALDGDGHVVVLQARPLRVGVPRYPKRGDLVERLGRYSVLLAGQGAVACRGVAAGRVVVVGADPPSRGIPPGSIVVARHSSPRLSALASSAAAIVTDVGATTGHLATVAREFRIPTIVGTGTATRVLRQGMEVTVDAEENVVYGGIVEELLAYGLLGDDVYEETPEFRLLRAMLRRIAPLHLTDPDDPGFTAERCQSYHDIIRFAHERALAELADLDVSGAGTRNSPLRRLELDVPLDLLVIDVGGGLTPGHGPVTVQDVQSRPLRLLLAGLTTRGVWTTDPAGLDLPGLMASATRSGTLALPGAATVERNTAIVSRDYLNLNLRVGYHFNVVDCHLGEGPEDSYIFFRFVGGVTDTVRRGRRARLLSEILEGHDFTTDRQGDLVVGRLRGVPRAIVEDRLPMLGRLIGFSRQLDIFLKDDAIVDRLIADFMQQRYGGVFDDGTENSTMSGKVEE